MPDEPSTPFPSPEDAKKALAFWKTAFDYLQNDPNVSDETKKLYAQIHESRLASFRDALTPKPPRSDIEKRIKELKESLDTFRNRPDSDPAVKKVYSDVEQQLISDARDFSKPDPPPGPLAAILPFGDPRIAVLGPWFREIAEAGTDPDAIRAVLKKRWNTVHSKGFQVLRDQIIQSTPLAVFLTPRGPALQLADKPNGGFREWGVPPPAPLGHIQAHLRRCGLQAWQDLEEFYAHFNGLYDVVDSGQCFVPIEEVLSHAQLLACCGEATLHLYQAADLDNYGAAFTRRVLSDMDPDQLACMANGQPLPDTLDPPFPPSSIAYLREWPYLYVGGWDKLLVHPSGKIAWALSMSAMFLLDMTFDEFIGHYVRLDKADGEDFMGELFSARNPADI